MDDSQEFTRREFMQVGTVSLLALQSGGNMQLENKPIEEYDFDGAAHLIGPSSARPEPGDPFFDNKTTYAYVYEDLNGARSFLADGDTSWTPINYVNHVPVFSADDLPAPTNGTHTLEGQTAYHFFGFVTSPYGLDISNGPVLLGRHAGIDGFIHTGGNTAITGTNGNYLQDSLYVHAPGGTIYDIAGDAATEMLVTDSAFSDAAGIAPISSLGLIDGMRVPTWKNCNFEDFADGITFDGSPDKIFVSASPLRNVTGSNTAIFTLADTCDVGIVDFVDNYIKNVQSDTVVWRVESGGEPIETMQYRGTTHDQTFTKGNAITGPNADPTVEPFWVSDSYPVRESAVAGELYLTGENTVTIDSAGTWYEVNGSTQTGNESERTQQANNGTIQYIGSRDVNVQLAVSTSFEGANGDIYEIAVSKNGTVESASTMEVEAGGQNAPVNPSTSAIEDLDPNDTISLQVRNQDSASDATFRAYTINFLG